MGGEVGSARTSATSMISDLAGKVSATYPEEYDGLQRGSRTATIAVLVMFVPPPRRLAHAQSTDELKQRIEELERSTREQVDALKRMLQQQEAERAKERRAQEERERTLRTLQEQVEQQQLSLQKQKRTSRRRSRACQTSST